MDAYSWIALYLSTFGVVAFSVLTYMTLKAEKKPPLFELVSSLAINMLSIFWFLLGIIDAVPYLGKLVQRQAWQLLFTEAALFFPPLICQIFYASERNKLNRQWPWLAGLAVSWLGALYSVSQILGVILGWSTISGERIGTFFQLGFSYTAVFCIALILWVKRTEKKEAKLPTEEERRSVYRRRMIFLLAVLLALPFTFWLPMLREVGFLVARTMPLTFVFVGLYYQQRYEFFDLVVKRGLFFFLVFGLLLIFFVGLPALVPDLRADDEGALLLTLAFLPLALSLPMLSRLLSRKLDQWWFGRQFEATEAAKEFLGAVRDSTDEQRLRTQSGRILGEIFLAEARVETIGTRAGEQESELIRGDEYGSITALTVPIQADGRIYGYIHMGERQSQTPYFRSDQKLLQTLAEILARMLENLRLQEKRKQQEKREQDLKLHASRSELKALRAQINPHFLFNALNAIASLIHQKPELAEETVEQLAEVFRYTLRRSEQEWVLLQDEFDFLSAYLDVERARFGDRLQYEVELEEEAAQIKVPGMMVQTLVENAVKHGLSSVRGVGRIGISARRQGDRLILKVKDNGPGFDLEEGLSRPDERRRGEGFGLKSVQRRLRGYYGRQARLEVTRDRENSLTVVRIEMPAESDSQQMAQGQAG
ncbi:MAG TPA: histidine kinase [Acidobacteriota bacterium]|nr:histidine kinase [Acidobacteriota bacterium]